MARFFDGYVGSNDPNLPGFAISLAALALLLRREAQGRAPEPAILLMVVAGFYKHNVVATPATALAWIALRSWKAGLRAALIGATAAAGGLLLCVALYGTDFIGQLLFPREYSLRWAVSNLGRLQWMARGTRAPSSGFGTTEKRRRRASPRPIC